MNRTKLVLLAAFVSLALAFTFSCSSDGGGSPNGGSDTQKFCVHSATKKCTPTTTNSCPNGGELSDFCPFSEDEGNNSDPPDTPIDPPINPPEDDITPAKCAGYNPADASNKGTFTDTRDNNKVYNTIKICNQTWMAQNINYNDGNGGSVCHGENSANCGTYGRLYNWEAAMRVCPTGWHLPSDDDWRELFVYAEEGECEIDNYGTGLKCPTAGKHLKAKAGWSFNGNTDESSEDTYGFSILAGGGGLDWGFMFMWPEIGRFAQFWGSTEEPGDDTSASHFVFGYGTQDAEIGTFGDKPDDYKSVRCLRNN